MYKLLGAIFILLSSVLIGLSIRKTYAGRVKLLSEILYACDTMECKLRCMCLPLYECFSQSGGIFLRASELMKNNDAPTDALKTAVKENEILDSADKEVLFSFADGLHAEDCEGQIENLSMLRQMMARRCADAEKKLDTKGNLAVKGSVLAACAAVILLV